MDVSANQLQYQTPLSATPPAASRRLHWAALLTAFATFPLIFVGGLVTSHHAGMSVPDWPNSYGYNMFLFPPTHWVGGILYEHTHRLAGTVVGFCSVVLVLFAWGIASGRSSRALVIKAIWAIAALAVLEAVLDIVLSNRLSLRAHGALSQSIVSLVGLDLVLLVACVAPPADPRRWVRWLSIGVLGAVLFQGLLGGLRVVLVKLDLAVVHACVAQAFFCLATLAAVVTSRWWASADDLSKSYESKSGRRLAFLGAATVGLIYLQLIAGATMRHYDAGLAIPDLPLAYGKVLPPATEDALAVANHHRTFDLDLDRVTLWQVWIHFTHRIGAVLVTIFAITLSTAALRRHRGNGLTGPAILLLLLLLTQLTLGVLTVLMRKPADVASAHVAVGALVLVTSFFLTVRAFRLYRPKKLANKIADSRTQSAEIGVLTGPGAFLLSAICRLPSHSKSTT